MTPLRFTLKNHGHALSNLFCHFVSLESTLSDVSSTLSLSFFLCFSLAYIYTAHFTRVTPFLFSLLFSLLYIYQNRINQATCAEKQEVIRKESKMAVQSDYGTSSFEPDLYNRLEKENIKNGKKKYLFFSPSFLQ